MRALAAFTCLVAIGAAARPVLAQSRTSHWGVDADFASRVQVPASQKKTFDAEDFSLSSTAWSVGFVRGAISRSYWGVSFASRTFKEATVVRDGESYRLSDVRLVGAELHKFVSIVTIARRAQIGVTLGIGAGVPRGTLVGDSGATLPARNLFLIAGRPAYALPTGRIEVTGAAIVLESVRVVVSGGIDYPGTDKIRVGVVYLFGAR